MLMSIGKQCILIQSGMKIVHQSQTSAVNVGNREMFNRTARTENREMNGIIQDQKTFQASRNLQSLDAAPSSLTHIREGKEYHARQILVDRSFPAGRICR